MSLLEIVNQRPCRRAEAGVESNGRERRLRALTRLRAASLLALALLAAVSGRAANATLGRCEPGLVGCGGSRLFLNSNDLKLKSLASLWEFSPLSIRLLAC